MRSARGKRRCPQQSCIIAARDNLLVLVLVLACLFSFVAAEHEVPMKKAMPPKMDPIPVLPEITLRVYFEIEKDGKKIGKISFGLFGKYAPKAVENFRALANCDRGKGKKSGKILCYKGSKFHRIIPNFMMQGGDFTHGDGSGGESIYDGELFEDEGGFALKHNRLTMLAMSNKGRPNTNGSQFYINTVKTQWLDGKHVIFGTVLHGHGVIDEIEAAGTYGGKPRHTITISDCGEEELQDEDKEIHF